MLTIRDSSSSNIVSLNVLSNTSKVCVLRKSRSIFGMNAPMMEKAVKVKPSNVEKMVAKKGIPVLGNVIRYL